MRDGSASAGAPAAAAVATAMPVGEPRVVLGQRGLRPPGQWPAPRSCHTTTSASSPMTPPWSPVLRPRPGPQPAACSMRFRWARRSRSRGCERTLRLRSDRRAARPGACRQRRGERAAARIGDRGAARRSPARSRPGQADQQLGAPAAPGPAVRSSGQQRAPDERGACGDRGRRGRRPARPRTRPRHRVPPGPPAAASSAPMASRWAAASARRCSERRIRQGPRGADRGGSWSR